MADHCPLLPERSPEQQLTIEGFDGAGTGLEPLSVTAFFAGVGGLWGVRRRKALAR